MNLRVIPSSQPITSVLQFYLFMKLYGRQHSSALPKNIIILLSEKFKYIFCRLRRLFYHLRFFSTATVPYGTSNTSEHLLLFQPITAELCILKTLFHLIRNEHSIYDKWSWISSIFIGKSNVMIIESSKGASSQSVPGGWLFWSDHIRRIFQRSKTFLAPTYFAVITSVPLKYMALSIRWSIRLFWHILNGRNIYWISTHRTNGIIQR